MIALIYPERTTPINTFIQDFSDIHNILGGKHEIVDHSPDGEITLVRENQENLEENQNFPSFNGVVVKIKEPLLLNHLAHIH